MASEYATAAGEPPAVAQALYEAELPRHAGDHLPTTPPGAILPLVDALTVAARHQPLDVPPAVINDIAAFLTRRLEQSFAEIQLHDTLGKTRDTLEGITNLNPYTDATTDLTHAVTEFFDQIYVMDNNPERRTTRLSLLAAITELGEHTLAWEHLHTC